MSKDEFTKLFKYVERRFNEMDRRFDEQNEKIDDIRAGVAELAGQIRDYHQEMIMLAHKVDRLERWIHEIAQKTGVKLSPP
ncbi:hypothetical protein DYH10_04345 [Candidatus Saccharibacteria bacterium CPR2]|nr:hypothetical protein [Candidatus Saccharibacteria bacterium CPR2]